MLTELAPRDTIEDLKVAAAGTSAEPALDAMVTALRIADELTALAVRIAGRLMPHGGIERATGLPTEFVLKLQAGRTTKEARLLAEAAATLKAMPCTEAAFSRGELSWDAVRLIVTAVRTIAVAERPGVDAAIDAELARCSEIDPEVLVSLVFDEVARLRSELLARREDRQIERSFLSIQPRLDGEGGSLHAEADAVSFATILEAIETAAPRPVDAEDPDTPSRARQRFDGLLAVCEASLAGGHTGTRPRPRLLATLDVAALDARGEAARILWRAFGRPGRLSTLATEVLSCDAEVVPVIFDGARPIAVGDATSDIPPKVRTALVARDQGCRFPGCSMPAGWTDAHHIFGRDRGHRIGELVLLCRRCHDRVHRRRWRVIPQADGTITFRYRGADYHSAPRIRTMARE